MLDKQETHLEKKMKDATKAALKKSRAKNKRGAIFELKRKKMFEKRLNQVYGQRENVERLINAMEVVSFNKETIETMKRGKVALEATIKEVDVDEVNDLMDDINENVAMADEVAEAMGQTIGNTDVDEEELEAELEALQNEEMEAKMLEVPELPVDEKEETKQESKEQESEEEIFSALSDAPAVPSTSTLPKTSNESKELDAVTASLGI